MAQMSTQRRVAIAISITIGSALTVGAMTERGRHALSLSWQQFLEEMHFILPAFVGLLILWREATLKLEAHRAEAKMNQEMQEKQLEFLKSKFDTERQERQERLALIEREAVSLRGVTSILAKQVAGQLTEDTRWASDALERAKLGARSKTLFGERISHFRDEKEYLAGQFLQSVLLPRCKHLVESGHRVFLLVDSGTTLRPVLEQLGQQAVKCRENQENWLDSVEVVTNNLPGVEALMDSGRRNPNNRYSSLAINCRLIPGVPLPVYSAVTGDQANKSIRELWENRSPKDHFIAVVTGNWVRIRRSTPACAIPLARGEGHQELKQALIDCSNEVYVVASLGKLFLRLSLEEVNQALGFKTENTDPDKWPYAEVVISHEKASQVKLVTTSRVYGRALYPLAQRAEAALDYDDAVIRAGAITEPKHVFFPFDNLPSNWWLEIEAEFPHEATRSREFQGTYFFVTSAPPDTARADR